MFSFSFVPKITRTATRRLQLLFTAVLFTMVFTAIFSPRTRIEEGDFDDSGSVFSTCPSGKPEERKLLIVFRIPIDLGETRNFVRTRVRNESIHCNMDAVFLFGRFHDAIGQGWQKIIRQENLLYGDILEQTIYHDHQLRDSFAVETLKPWITSNPCKIYRNVAFGTFVLPDDLVNRVTREKVLPEKWTEDDCLKFAKHRADTVQSVKFFAHYFPPRLDNADSTIGATGNKVLYQAVVSPHNYRYLSDGTQICSKLTGKRLLAIFAVHSSALNFANRQMIRATWGSKAVMAQQKSLLIFYLGINSTSTNYTADIQKLQKESADYNDIVQEDFEENYKNMTLKQISILKHVTEYCSAVEYSFVFKTDDDIVIDMRSVGQFMKTLTNQGLHVKRNIFCFHLNERTIVPRDPNDKWYVSRKEYPADVYPAYCSGAGYFISKGLVKKLYDAALRTETFWVDDAFITGVLPEVIGDIVLVQIPKQYPIISHSDLVHHEDISGKFIVHVKQNLELFQAFWNHFQRKQNN